MTHPATAGLLTDAELIQQSRHSPDRFTAVFDRHYRDIYRYVSRRLGPDLAEDVASETFLTAFDRRHTFDVSRADARPWLYGIASNLVARHVRTETRRYQALAKAHRQEPDGHHGHADEVVGRLDAAAVRGRLATALRKLPEPVRAVLLLVAWAGLTQQEAADALGIPPGTARSRLHRARQEMRQALEADQ